MTLNASVLTSSASPPKTSNGCVKGEEEARSPSPKEFEVIGEVSEAGVGAGVSTLTLKINPVSPLSSSNVLEQEPEPEPIKVKTFTSNPELIMWDATQVTYLCWCDMQVRYEIWSLIEAVAEYFQAVPQQVLWFQKINHQFVLYEGVKNEEDELRMITLPKDLGYWLWG